MQITPVYDDPPVLSLPDLGAVDAVVRQQRTRMLTVLRSLDASQWDAASRCEKWSVKDVVSHLISTDRFWAISFRAGMNGEPTRFLEAFDPVASPEQMVETMRVLPGDAVLSQYETQAANLFGALEKVADWSVLAEAPPGHIPLNAAASHALWDAWVHERDIVIPLGLPTTEADEEMRVVLQYAAALSPAFSVATRSGRRGSLTVEAHDPAVAFTVEVADRVVVREGGGDGGPQLHGAAVDLIEGLSHRAPLPTLPPDDQWLLAGLAEVFDVAT
jgi:uncharacterized protein (TIGR03083 family)